jgi:hydrogenase 3 maturation protease
MVTPLRVQLRSICKGKVLLLGVGNRMRADDGAGPVVVDGVTGRCPIVCIDAGVAPENYLEKVVKAVPDTVLIADAVEFDGRAGEIKVFGNEALAGGGISTHALSLTLVCEYLRNRGIVAGIFLIGIKPRNIALGAPMSNAVKRSAGKLANELANVYAG